MSTTVNFREVLHPRDRMGRWVEVLDDLRPGAGVRAPLRGVGVTRDEDGFRVAGVGEFGFPVTTKDPAIAAKLSMGDLLEPEVAGRFEGTLFDRDVIQDLVEGFNAKSATHLAATTHIKFDRKTSGEPCSVAVGGILATRDPQSIVGTFDWRYSLYDGEWLASHDTLMVGDNVGAGRKFTRHLEGEYPALGVKKVKLLAAMGSGGYVWAQEGYGFAAPRDERPEEQGAGRRAAARAMFTGRADDWFWQAEESVNEGRYSWDDVREFSNRFPVIDMPEGFDHGENDGWSIHDAADNNDNAWDEHGEYDEKRTRWYREVNLGEGGPFFSSPAEVAMYGIENAWTEDVPGRGPTKMWLGKQFMLGALYHGEKTLEPKIAKAPKVRWRRAAPGYYVGEHDGHEVEVARYPGAGDGYGTEPWWGVIIDGQGPEDGHATRREATASALVMLRDLQEAQDDGEDLEWIVGEVASEWTDWDDDLGFWHEVARRWGNPLVEALLTGEWPVLESQSWDEQLRPRDRRGRWVRAGLGVTGFDLVDAGIPEGAVDDLLDSLEGEVSRDPNPALNRRERLLRQAKARAIEKGVIDGYRHKNTQGEFWKRMESLGHTRPPHLREAIDLQEAKAVNVVWDPQLHPRGRTGRFVDVAEVLSKLALTKNGGLLGRKAGVLEVENTSLTVKKYPDAFAIIDSKRGGMPVKRVETAEQAARFVTDHLNDTIAGIQQAAASAAWKAEKRERDLQRERDARTELEATQRRLRARYERDMEDFDRLYPKDPQGRRYFHRADPPAVADRIITSGVLKGRRRRNTNAGLHAEVKAHFGRVPPPEDRQEGLVYVEFVTDLLFDGEGSPKGHRFAGWTPARRDDAGDLLTEVFEDGDDWAVLQIQVTAFTDPDGNVVPVAQ